jgi:hypothetical protein
MTNCRFESVRSPQRRFVLAAGTALRRGEPLGRGELSYFSIAPARNKEFPDGSDAEITEALRTLLQPKGTTDSLSGPQHHT